MKANNKCSYSYLVTVYLNGKKLNDCVEADEEAGEVLVIYRDTKGKIVPAIEAENGALTYEGAQVIKLRGDVRIEIDYDYLKRAIEESYKPLGLTRVQYVDEVKG
jgi:hypothetical protein